MLSLSLGLAAPLAADTCSPGTFKNSYDQKCYPCPPGLYTDKPDMFSCAAWFSGAPSSASCTVAPAGYFVATAGATAASICPVGRFSAAGSTSCLLAPAGSYVATQGAGAATLCPAGTYSGTGASACTPCPAGMTSTAGSASCK
jgi:hypothetical protein